MKTGLLVGALAVMLAASLYFSGMGSAPEGQPAVVELAGIEAFRADFNAAAGTARVILSVAPTCPYCLKGLAVAQRILEDHTGAPVTVFVAWQPILPTDWGKPGSSVLGRLHDRRARQYWDPEHRVAEAVRAAGEAREQWPECCYEGEIWWDFAAAYPAGELWGEMLPKAGVLNGTIEDAAAELETFIAAAPR